MGDSSMRGMRVGILTTLFGAAPEDARGRARSSAARSRRSSNIGVEAFDIAIPGYDEVMQNTSVINAEFKFDLMDYLGGVPEGAGAIVG